MPKGCPRPLHHQQISPAPAGPSDKTRKRVGAKMIPPAAVCCHRLASSIAEACAKAMKATSLAAGGLANFRTDEQDRDAGQHECRNRHKTNRGYAINTVHATSSGAAFGRTQSAATHPRYDEYQLGRYTDRGCRRPCWLPLARPANLAGGRRRNACDVAADVAYGNSELMDSRIQRIR